MLESRFQLSFHDCRELLRERLAEPAPGRIQLLAGPRQVGKTTLVLEFVEKFGDRAVYIAADSPEAALPGFWDRAVGQVEDIADERGSAVLFFDEAHLVHDWAAELKGASDRFRRTKRRIHIVATGSSSLHLAHGSRESLAGRFERITLSHWSAASLASEFRVSKREAAKSYVQMGSYPGAFSMRKNLPRWAAYVRDAILEPAIGKDIVNLASVRKPAILRQVFGVAATSPAQIVSLQKIQGQLHDPGALETVANYLHLLEEAFLVAGLNKFTASGTRQRAAPPKLVPLSNAILAVTDSRGLPDPTKDPARFGALVENACIAHAWNAGQQVSYWREEPLEVDLVSDGSWGAWAIEVKTGKLHLQELTGLAEFTRRNPRYRPLIVCSAETAATAGRSGIAWTTWEDFLLEGPPRTH
jgi:predicted AAA+ superfamily ATPase